MAPSDEGSTVETPLAKVEHLLRLRCRAAALDRLIAEHAPARVRPWHSLARPNQIPPPGDWSIALFLAGRGFGKSRLAAEWIAEQAAIHPGTEWAIVAPTWRDCKKNCIEAVVNAMLPGELESMNSSDLLVRFTNGSKVWGYSSDGFERLRGSNLAGAWCVAKGTPVTTSRGNVPIESVQSGDLVATRQGWRSVTASRRTGVDRQTLAIKTTAGILRCTPDHRIAVSENGWREARHINVGDILIGCTMTQSLDHPHGSSSTATASTGMPGAATTTTQPAISSITRCGRPLTGLYQTATRCITAIMNAATTAWSTWNYSPRSSTRSATPQSNGSHLFRHACAWCAVRNSSPRPKPRTFSAAQSLAEPKRLLRLARNAALIVGMSLRWSASSVESRSARQPGMPLAALTSVETIGVGPVTVATLATGLAVTDSQSSGSVLCAAESSSPLSTAPSLVVTLVGRSETRTKPRRFGKASPNRHGRASNAAISSSPARPWPDTAASSAEHAPVVLDIVRSLDCDVYDLTVEDAHEFYAGGVLVHNCDEMAVYANPDELFSEALMPALRIGESPRLVITTTPRPIPFLRSLVARDDGSVVVIKGSTWDNAANLSKTALAELRTRYEGTRTGRQELLGELLSEIAGAFWSLKLIEDTRVKDAPALARIVVAMDPATTSGEKSDQTGIIVAGRGMDGHLYVLEDLSMKASPHACMATVVKAYHRWQADKIVAETNNGGDYLENVLRSVDENAAYTTVRATRGKSVRAEPISSLWEQGRAHIVGCLPDLEDQMAACTPPDANGKDRRNKDPDDRLDAMIYAATELQVGASAMLYLSAISKMCPKCDMPNSKRFVACQGCGAQLPDAEAA